MGRLQWIGCLLGFWVATSVTVSPAEDNNAVNDTEIVKQTLEQHRDSIMSQPGVVGTGLSLCEGKPCIRVLVVRRTAELEQVLEQLLGNQRFIIEESGPIRAQPQDK